ncbi:filamentous hemagglutinin N-terminal domain-containing protein [Simkania sp.]|uniref:two-partner secretion domain-containing protein n=1 Tax=Simkania sp. TaxID=34094 RepID=UPI003B521F8C
MGKLSLAIGAFLLGGVSLFAGPENGAVAHGHATFQPMANGIEIHSGNKTIINWENFSIDAGEVARFCQSSSASAVLNRVIGSDKSLINGLLTSNGHVFLLNQNGILIGKEGVINTASFVASTLDLSNDQFLQGDNFLFKGDGKESVINLGTIHAKGGDVFLIGYHVSNEGTILADGVTGMCQGAEVFLAVEGEERLFIRKAIDSSEVGASNDGVIRAAEVEIKASSNPFALAIRHGGEIEATGVAHRNGRVLLVADSGKTEVTGTIQTESGTVHILGDEVHLTETGFIDVSGDVGGEVLLGGDYRGSNPEIPNARGTYLDKGATIVADGHHGDGGKVIVWGNETAHYYGDISAAALGEVGDGGFVEVSAKSNDYIFQGPVRASSLNGAKGKLLLDPPRIRVRFVGSSPSFPQGGPNTYMPTPPPNTANLNPNDFTGILAGNTDVFIDSTAPGGGNGDIDFQASFSWSGAGVLYATAFRNITVTGPTALQASNGGGFNFTALGNGGSNNDGIRINGDLITDSGPITLNGTSASGGGVNVVGVDVDGSLTTTNGAISITGVSQGTGSAAHGIDITGTVSASGSGTITFDGTGSASGSSDSYGVDLNGATISSNSGLIDITGQGGAGVDDNRGIWIGNNSSVTSTTGGVTILGTGNGTGSDDHGVEITDSSLVRSVTSGDISITGISGGSLGSTYGVLLDSSAVVESIGSGNVTLDGTSGSSAGSGNIGVQVIGGSTLSGASGVVSIIGVGGTGTTGNHGVALSTAGTVTSPGGLVLTGTSSSGNNSIGVLVPIGVTAQTSGTGSITITGNATGTGTTTPGVFIEGDVTATGSGSISVTGNSAGNASHGIDVDGNITAGAGGISFMAMSTGTGISDAIVVEGIVSTTSSGPIGMTGTASGAAGTSDGIDIRLGGRVSSVDGAINLNGTSNGLGNECTGIELQANGGVESTGLGSVTLTGVGSTSGTDEARGVKVTSLFGGGPSFISVNDGDLLITGTGNGTTTDNEGFLLGLPGDLGSFVRSNGNGSITINGTGSSGGTTGNPGIRITEGLSVTSLGSGDISFDGQGGAGNDGYGVFVHDGADVTASGSGNISLKGTGGTGNTNTYGVYITDASSLVTSNSGNVSLDGTRGSGAGGSHNVGVYIENGGTLSSTGGGIVTIKGIGGGGAASTLNHGVELVASGTVSSPTGLVLDGTSSQGTNSRGVLLAPPVVATTGSGNISITGVSSADAGSPAVEIGVSVSNTGTGTVSIQGTCSGSGATSPGVFVTSGTVSSTSGDINIAGTGQDASGSPIGVLLNDATINTNLAGTLKIEALAGDFQTLSSGSTIQNANGSLSIIAAEAVTFNPVVTTINSPVGPVLVQANNGAITMDDAATVTTTNGPTRLEATGAVDLGVVNVGVGGSITVLAGGAVNDMASASPNLTGLRAYIRGTQIGPLPTSLSILQAETTAAGTGIEITNNKALFLASWSPDGMAGLALKTTNNAKIKVTNTIGAMTVSNLVQADGTGTVELTASTGATNVNANTSSGSGTITINGTAVNQNTNSVISTGGAGTVDVTATSTEIMMAGGTSITTAGGTATLNAISNAHLSTIDATTAGNIFVTAQTGAITNNTGANTPPILIADVATLSAHTGIGSGIPTDPTAIGTNLRQLIATNSVSGDVVIFDTATLPANQGIELGNIHVRSGPNVPVGNFYVDANGPITQTGAAIVEAIDATFITSRDGTIGTVAVQNGTNTTLGESIAAGDLTITVPVANSVGLSGDVTVGRDFTVNGGSFNDNGFTVSAVGTIDTPEGFNVITAFGASTSFDISNADIANNNLPVTINLLGGYESAANQQLDPAITVNNSGNNMTGTVVVTTVDPQLSFTEQYYDLIQSAALTFNAGQTLTINAPLGSTFGGLNPRNLGSGSSITLTNVGNIFPERIATTFPFTTQITGETLQIGQIEAYGDLTLQSLAGGTGITTGLNNQPITVNAAGTVTMTADAGNVTVDRAVTTNTGSISLTAANNVSIGLNGSLTVSSGATGTASLTANSGSVSVNGIAQVNTQGGAISLTANNAGGSILLDGSSQLNSSGGAITLESTGVGNLITMSGGTEINSGGGNVTATSNGNLTADKITAAAGDVMLTSNAGDVIVNDPVTTTTGSISVTGNNNISLASAGSLAVTTGLPGTATLTATNGSITLNGASQVNTQGGAISLTANNAGGGIALTSTSQINNAGGTVTLESTGAGNLITMAVGSEINSNGGDVSVTANGGVIADKITAGAGTIGISATAGNVLVNDDVNTTTGNVTITGDTGITVEGDGDVMTTTGQANLTATTGTITIKNSSQVATQGGPIELKANGAGGSILLNDTSQVNNVGGPVTLESTGAGNLITMASGTEINSGGGSVTATSDGNLTADKITAAAGDVMLTSNAGDVLVNDAVTTTTGSISISGNNNISVAPAGSVAVTTGLPGTATLTATTGSITLNGASQVNTQGGAISLTANNAGGAILLNSSSQINNAGGTVTLESIGAGNQITMATLAEINSNGGSVSITGDGKVTGTKISSGAGIMMVTSNSDEVDLLGQVSSTTGNITVTGATGVTVETDGDVTATTGQANLIATTGPITLNGTSQVSTQGGPIALSANGAGGGILLNDTTQINNVGGTVTLESTGAGNQITMATTSEINSNGGAVSITGDGTVTGAAISSAAGTLMVTSNSDEVDLLGQVSSTTGNITVTGATGVTVETDGDVTATTGQANLIATTGPITLNGTSQVSTQGGPIALTASGLGGGILLNNTSQINNVGGTIQLQALGANTPITMQQLTEINSNGGNVTLSASGNINVAQVNAATGDATASTTSGMIIDATASPVLPNFIANTVRLSADSGIGSQPPVPPSTSDIALVANFLEATTTSGDIVISELDGVTLLDITNQGGGFYLETGGLIDQAISTKIDVQGDLVLETTRATTLGTVRIFNSEDIDLDESVVTGNYSVTTPKNLTLQGSQTAGLNIIFTTGPSPTYGFDKNGQIVTQGGELIINGVDSNLSGDTINAIGPGPDFDFALANPLSTTDPVITVNLRTTFQDYPNTHSANAIVLENTDNIVHGNIKVTTVNPGTPTPTTIDYNLTQSAPFSLGAGQTLDIQAARGSLNPPVGPLPSMWGNSALNSGMGSMVTLDQANDVQGMVIVRDPDTCTVYADQDLVIDHVNNYNTLDLEAQNGALTIIGSGVRSSGATLTLKGGTDINLNAIVSGIDPSNNLTGEINYTATSGSITGTAQGKGTKITFSAPAGEISDAHIHTPETIFQAKDHVTITAAGVGATFSGSSVDGDITLNQNGNFNLTAKNIAITSVAPANQTISLTCSSGAIQHISGLIDAGSNGIVNFNALSGISGTGLDSTLQSRAESVLAINSTSGDVRIRNTLAGNNSVTTNVMLFNGVTNIPNNQNLYYRQLGGSSVDFGLIMADGEATLLAINGSANMTFSGPMQLASKSIAAANRDITIGAAAPLTMLGDSTFVVDQEFPVEVGPGIFANLGSVSVASDNLAIYAVGGPQPPANAAFDPPNQVILGTLSGLATWDQALPAGLDTKYNTSYSAGGPHHGPGFGNSYVPGQGNFGSQVIWYKFDVDRVPVTPSSSTVPFDPRVGINAWEVGYFLQYWNENLNRLGYQNTPMMLVETNFETEPLIYEPYEKAINKLRNKGSSE